MTEQSTPNERQFDHGRARARQREMIAELRRMSDPVSQQLADAMERLLERVELDRARRTGRTGS